jgi:DNA invertase Pin-like site-specific DNA recombinase
MTTELTQTTLFDLVEPAEPIDLSIPAVYGYGRGSTSRQEITLEAQAKMCEDEYRSRSREGGDWAGMRWGGFLADSSQSGSKPWFHRPQGELLSTQLKKGDVIVISKLDRAFRNLLDAYKTIDDFGRMKIRLCIIGMPIDFSTPEGLMMSRILATFAEFERDMIGKRTSDALKMKKLSGKVAHGCSPIGWYRHRIYDPSAPKNERKEYRPSYHNRALAHLVRYLREEKMLGLDLVSRLLHRSKVIEDPRESFKRNGRKQHLGVGKAAKLKKYVRAVKLGFPNYIDQCQTAERPKDWKVFEIDKALYDEYLREAESSFVRNIEYATMKRHTKRQNEEIEGILKERDARGLPRHVPEVLDEPLFRLV